MTNNTDIIELVAIRILEEAFGDDIHINSFSLEYDVVPADSGDPILHCSTLYEMARSARFLEWSNSVTVDTGVITCSFLEFIENYEIDPLNYKPDRIIIICPDNGFHVNLLKKHNDYLIFNRKAIYK